MPVKVRDLIAMLEAEGWKQVRQKGSHRQFHHPIKPGTVTVAGSLVWIFRQARSAAS